MDFDFSRFSPRSFEKFAQALTVRALGPGMEVYGDGPDGGREAVFQGSADFPSAAEPWRGYTVVQVKYRQNAGNAAEDAEWLVGELREELDAYLDPTKERRSPEQYLLVTNARLSPVPKTRRGSGGIAKIEAVFEEYRDQIGFKDFKIWHYDELCVRLADAEEIRRAYSAWVTPSDVLSDVLSSLKLRGADFGEVMHRYLQREVRSQRSTRLQQAGHGGGDVATHLEDVFVDLPFEESHPDPEAPQGELLLASLLRRSRQKLSPSDISSRVRPRPDRLLLLGGPGQGKSTISQLLAQILRASLLGAEKRRPMSAEADAAVRSVLAGTANGGLADEAPRRFPIRIDLPVYADALSSRRAEGGALPLLTYIRDQIALVATAPELDLSDLRAWLGAFPFVLLLDGLDEVPPSANRGEVIASLNDLWDELASVNADVLMLVTTRPQGYNDDLDPALYGSLEMTPLQPNHAMAYARRLANGRLLDLSQRERVLARMAEAIETPTTARLLVSPLQVAIMLALIDQRGEAPSDRWTLFEKYFSVVLEREQQKPGIAGRTVKTWSRTIGALHHNIGFALHLQAERGGGSDAQLTRGQLETLVRDQLQHDGYEGGKLDRAAAELLETTTDRLVLLVQRVDQRYSFEVRSLQEFMAAAYLMSGREVAVQERLREIANKSHWRHVFQIAASKCFSSNDTLQYRDTILSICRELNTSGEVDIALRSGARLALALIDDGLAYDTPLWRRRLLVEAMDLIQASSPNGATALVDLLREEGEFVAPRLRPLLMAAQYRTRLNAWALLISLTALETDWAIDLAVDAWPSDPARRLEILTLGIAPAIGSPLHSLFEDVITSTPLDTLADELQTHEFTNADSAAENLSVSIPALGLLTGLDRNARLTIKLRTDDREGPLTFQVMSVSVPSTVRNLHEFMPDTEAWKPAKLLADFHANPSAVTLANTLREVHAAGFKKAFSRLSIFMPWPLFAAMRQVDIGMRELVELADQAESGDFGDLTDWQEAERRWTAQGVTEDDLRHLVNKGISAGIGVIGAPHPSGVSMTHGFKPPHTWQLVLTELLGDGDATMARLFRWLVDFSVETYPPAEPFDAPLAHRLVGHDDEGWIRPGLVAKFSAAAQSDATTQELLARKAILGRVYIMTDRGSGGVQIDRALFDSVSTVPGLLPFFLNLWGADCRDHDALMAAARTHSTHADPRIAAAATALCMMASNAEIGDLAVPMREPTPRFGLYHLMNGLSSDVFRLDAALGLANALVTGLAEDPSDGYERAYSQLSRFADQRRSDLEQDACFSKLELRASLCRLPAEV
ncbi:NACHT domain-containing NTPase [Brevundimonas sp.]|uniref:NACHT domain-containing protein n=1 Tax=Brevundimonas sp. TaxID=1871086 RepID=UPI00356459E2